MRVLDCSWKSLQYFTDFRALTQLLSDLNLFVLSMDLTIAKQDVLSLNETPDRERQKLIREQNILKKVGLFNRSHEVSSLLVTQSRALVIQWQWIDKSEVVYHYVNCYFYGFSSNVSSLLYIGVMTVNRLALSKLNRPNNT